MRKHILKDDVSHGDLRNDVSHGDLNGMMMMKMMMMMMMMMVMMIMMTAPKKTLDATALIGSKMV